MTAGLPQGEDPHVRKDPQTLTYRDCLSMNGHPLRERERERVGADTGLASFVDTDSGPFYGLIIKSHKYIIQKRCRRRRGRVTRLLCARERVY